MKATCGLTALPATAGPLPLAPRPLQPAASAPPRASRNTCPGRSAQSGLPGGPGLLAARRGVALGASGNGVVAHPQPNPQPQAEDLGAPRPPPHGHGPQPHQPPQPHVDGGSLWPVAVMQEVLIMRQQLSEMKAQLAAKQQREEELQRMVAALIPLLQGGHEAVERETGPQQPAVPNTGRTEQPTAASTQAAAHTGVVAGPDASGPPPSAAEVYSGVSSPPAATAQGPLLRGSAGEGQGSTTGPSATAATPAAAPQSHLHAAREGGWAAGAAGSATPQAVAAVGSADQPAGESFHHHQQQQQQEAPQVEAPQVEAPQVEAPGPAPAASPGGLLPHHDELARLMAAELGQGQGEGYHDTAQLEGSPQATATGGPAPPAAGLAGGAAAGLHEQLAQLMVQELEGAAPAPGQQLGSPPTLHGAPPAAGEVSALLSQLRALQEATADMFGRVSAMGASAAPAALAATTAATPPPAPSATAAAAMAAPSPADVAAGIAAALSAAEQAMAAVEAGGRAAGHSAAPVPSAGPGAAIRGGRGRGQAAGARGGRGAGGRAGGRDDGRGGRGVARGGEARAAESEGPGSRLEDIPSLSPEELQALLVHPSHMFEGLPRLASEPRVLAPLPGEPGAVGLQRPVQPARPGAGARRAR